jgi:hypothetical protein
MRRKLHVDQLVDQPANTVLRNTPIFDFGPES